MTLFKNTKIDELVYLPSYWATFGNIQTIWTEIINVIQSKKNQLRLTHELYYFKNDD